MLIKGTVNFMVMSCTFCILNTKTTFTDSLHHLVDLIQKLLSSPFLLVAKMNTRYSLAIKYNGKCNIVAQMNSFYYQHSHV